MDKGLTLAQQPRLTVEEAIAPLKMAPERDEDENATQKRSCDFDSLHFLLKAPSKGVVKQLLQNCFVYLKSQAPHHFFEETANSLEIQVEEAKQMISSISQLIKLALFNSTTDPKEAFGLFPDNFHKNLRELLSKLIAENMPSWRADTISQQVSLPRLTDFDWRIHMKTAASGRLAVPSCLLQIKVDGGGDLRDGIHSFSVELTKETLETMLDGLAKIRLQLNSVVSR